MHGVNLLGWAGKLELATRNLELASDLNALYMPQHLGSRRVGNRTLYNHLYQSHLATALGAPTRELEAAWDAIADSARKTGKAGREAVITYGWAAALGLYLQDRSDPRPIEELQALGGGATPPEIEALRALDRRDTARVRELLQQPDTALAMQYKSRAQWSGYRAMIAAHLWFDIGEDNRALLALDQFDHDHFSTMSLDVRWFLLGQARLLRGSIYERQGKRKEARQESSGRWRNGRVRSRAAGTAGHPAQVTSGGGRGIGPAPIGAGAAKPLRMAPDSPPLDSPMQVGRDDRGPGNRLEESPSSIGYTAR